MHSSATFLKIFKWWGFIRKLTYEAIGGTGNPLTKHRSRISEERDCSLGKLPWKALKASPPFPKSLLAPHLHCALLASTPPPRALAWRSSSAAGGAIIHFPLIEHGWGRKEGGREKDPRSQAAMSAHSLSLAPLKGPLFSSLCWYLMLFRMPASETRTQ